MEKKTNNIIRKKRPSAKGNASLTDYFVLNKSEPNYKDVILLRRFINDRGKLISQAYSGLTAKNQRKVSAEVKKARFMALLPYTDKHAL